MPFFQVNDHCNGCLACVQNCPANALKAEDIDEKRTLLHNMTRCARCGNCWRVCPQDAIEFQHLMQSDWDTVVALNIIRCRVCGEILYTSEFANTLTGKLDHERETLCPNHRQELDLMAEAHFLTAKPKGPK